MADLMYEHKGSLEKLVKIEDVQASRGHPLATSRELKNKSQPQFGEIHDLSTTDYWPAMVRKFIDDGKRNQESWRGIPH